MLRFGRRMRKFIKIDDIVYELRGEFDDVEKAEEEAMKMFRNGDIQEHHIAVKDTRGGEVYGIYAR